MSSLREIKDRIASVRSTLKITSAMKLVASSKLRKSQRAIEGLRPYETALADIQASLSSGITSGTSAPGPDGAETGACRPGTAVIAIAGNSSLCGGFNANVVKKALEVVRSCGADVEVHSLGRKMAEAMRRAGYPSPSDYSDIVARPDYAKAAALSAELERRIASGALSRVILVYTRFISTSRHEVVVEQMLPLPGAAVCAAPEDYLVEPSAAVVMQDIAPQLVRLRLYAAVLDSAASEHAARTIAMQTATDNAEDLLAELTLEYNKGRQQKITAEILDLLGGSAGSRQ